jgi:hypothetical protein
MSGLLDTEGTKSTKCSTGSLDTLDAMNKIRQGVSNNDCEGTNIMSILLSSQKPLGPQVKDHRRRRQLTEA